MSERTSLICGRMNKVRMEFFGFFISRWERWKFSRENAFENGIKVKRPTRSTLTFYISVFNGANNRRYFDITSGYYRAADSSDFKPLSFQEAFSVVPVVFLRCATQCIKGYWDKRLWIIWWLSVRPLISVGIDIHWKKWDFSIRANILGRLTG